MSGDPTLDGFTHAICGNYASCPLSFTDIFSLAEYFKGKTKKSFLQLQKTTHTRAGKNIVKHAAAEVTFCWHRC